MQEAEVILPLPTATITDMRILECYEPKEDFSAKNWVYSQLFKSWYKLRNKAPYHVVVCNLDKAGMNDLRRCKFLVELKDLKKRNKHRRTKAIKAFLKGAA